MIAGIALTLLATAQNPVAVLNAKLATAKSNVAEGADGWLFFAPELRHLAVGKFWGADAAKVSKAPAASADPLPAILDFKAQVERVGAKLLLVPVPAKATIYPEKLASELTAPLSGSDREFFRVLQSKGVDVLDLTDAFIAAKGRANLFCRRDTHWSGTGAALAGASIAAKLNLLRPGKYTGVERSATILGDLDAMRGSTEQETLKIVSVNCASTDRKSPLLLVGDSHCLVFSAGGDLFAEKSGLPEAIATSTGIVPDVVAVRGSGATPARVNLARRGDNLKGKKWVVWVFTVREFTEGQGWRKVPVVRPDN